MFNDPYRSLIIEETDEIIKVYKGLGGIQEWDSKYIETAKLKNRKNYEIIEEEFNTVTYRKLENINEVKKLLKIKDPK
jgi:hypothetical protein